MSNDNQPPAADPLQAAVSAYAVHPDRELTPEEREHLGLPPEEPK